MNIIFDYNQTLYNPKTDGLFPGVLDVLTSLASRHELSLVTLDRPERRSSKSIDLIKEFFTKIYFVERKTETLFRQICGDEPCIIIGDRLEDEVGIGMRLKKTTILVETQSSGSHFDQQPTHKVKNIREVVNIVRQYE